MICPHENTNFSREFCGLCTEMHNHCLDCGDQVEECGPDRWANDDEVAKIVQEITEARRGLLDRLANPPVDWEKEYNHLWGEYQRVVRKKGEALKKLDKIAALYEQRCEETIHEYTDGEEEFLADLSAVLEGEE